MIAITKNHSLVIQEIQMRKSIWATEVGKKGGNESNQCSSFGTFVVVGFFIKEIFSRMDELNRINYERWNET